jgi:hypothetical protein
MPILSLLVAAAAAPLLDACGLLTSAEVAAVQGGAPRDARPTERRDGELIAQQCFYLAPDPAFSVSLEVRRPAPRVSARALSERWKEMLKEDSEPGEDRPGPRRVTGLGRSALWVGDAKLGALYVLGRTAIVRVSVGGPAGEKAKIRACKSLARRVLRRL